MNLFIRLFFACLIVSVSAFSQSKESKPDTTGLRKISGPSAFEVIERNMSNMALNIEPIHINIPAIDIEAFEINIPNIDIHIEPIEFDIPAIDVDMERIEINIPEIDIEPIEIDLDQIDIDTDDFDWNKDDGNNEQKNEKSKGLKKIN
jgi:hypothetical protein